MSFCLIRHLIRKDLSNFRRDPFTNVIRSSLFHSKKDAFYVVTASTNDAVKRIRLPFPPVKRSFCVVNSKMVECNGGDGYYTILKEIGEKNSMSKEYMINCIERIHALLDSQKLESAQKRMIQESKPFVRLLTNINKNMKSIPTRDLIKVLDVCDKLNMSFLSKFCVSLLSIVALQLNDLDFTSRIQYLLFMEHNLSKKVALRLKGHLHSLISEKIMDKSYFKSSDKSSDCLEAAIKLSCSRTASLEIAESVLRDVIDLEVWDHPAIYLRILNIFFRLKENQRREIETIFFKKIDEEILKCNNIRFLSLFLHTYGKLWVNRGEHLVYDAKLIDQVVNKALEMDMEDYYFRKFTQALEDLNFTHHKFLECLVNRLKTSSDSNLEYPGFVKDFVCLLANSNCDKDTVKRWSGIESVLKDSHGFKIILESSKKVPEFNVYFILQLTSLGIFIDEELIHLSNFFNDADFVAYPKKIWRFLLYINQAVKVLHPPFSNYLLRDNFVPIILLGLNETKSSLVNTFIKLNQILSSFTKVRNSMLYSCKSRSGLPIGALVGVNKDGQIFDFTTFLRERDGVKNGNVYFEDITLPEGFKLVTVHYLGKSEHSGNTYDVNAPRSLTRQILNALGYPALYIYDIDWKMLSLEEKGEYLHREICNKYFDTT